MNTILEEQDHTIVRYNPEETELDWHSGTEESAINYAKARIEWVVVEGPGDEEWTAMPIRDAIDNGFLYSWYK